MRIRAKALGKPLGRPSALSVDQQAEVREKLQNGETISASRASSKQAGRQSCASEIMHSPVGLYVTLLG